MSSPAAPHGTSQKKKKKKKRTSKMIEEFQETTPRSECREEQETPPPLPQTPPKQKKKRRSDHLEDQVTPPPPPQTPPQKKKKKRRSEHLEEQETPPPPPPQTPRQKKNKKKRRSEHLEEQETPPPPSPPHQMPPQKKKKKKRRSEHLEEAPAPPSPQIPPLKKKRSEHLEEQEAPQTPPQKKKKKKKKRRSEHLEVEETPSSPQRRSGTLEEPHAPAPQRKSEDLEEAPAPPPPQTPPQQKKKKKRSEHLGEQEAPPSPAETPPPQKKKKMSGEEEISTPKNGRSLEAKKGRGQKENGRSRKRKEGQSLEAKSGRCQKKKRQSLEMERGRGQKRTGRSQEEMRDHPDESLKEKIGREEFDWAEFRELEEFVPTLRKKSAFQIRNLLRYDLHRFRAFKEQGIALRKGRCNKEENQRIMDNMADFLSLTGIPTAAQLMFPERFTEQEEELRKLRVEHNFLERIAEGIPRPCHAVYVRAKKLFDPQNHMGRFSPDEIDSLLKLHSLYGNNWKKISSIMERSIYSLQKRFNTISSACGYWKPDEETRLKRAVWAHLENLAPPGSGSELSRDQLCNNLPWMRISKQVKTRSWGQCRLKWFSILKKRLSPGQSVFNRGTRGLRTRILLIQTLAQMEVDDLNDVDWNHVAETIGNVSANCVQKNFHRMKVLKVPHWNQLSFGEIVDVLQHSILPELENQLQTMGGEGEAGLPTEGAEPHPESYQLSDILFEDYAEG